MEAVVRRLRRDEMRTASSLLARAFADDPFIGHFFGDQRRRRLALPAFFRAVLHELSPSGALYGADENGKLAGVAAWLPPAPAVATRRSRWLEAAASIEVRLLFPRAAPSLLTGFQTLGEHHPPVPHWYLAFVGIEPAQQRRGIGRKLLAPVLERADAGAVACYLETPFPGTRAFYRQLGFEEAGQLQPVAEAPPIWTMTRPPQAGMSSVG